MSKLNNDIVLEYLIESLNGLDKKYALRDVLLLDYCYKKNEMIPNDYFSGFISKILDKQVNSPANHIGLDESNLVDCLFLESYKSLLSNKVKKLIGKAKTAQDFKAILAIDVLVKLVDNPDSVLVSPASLDSKVYSLVKTYEENNFEKNLKEEYAKMRKYSLMINDDLKKPFSEELAEKFKNVKKDLDEKLETYSRYPDKGFVSEFQSLIRGMNSSIDNKFKNYLSSVDQKYAKIKKNFEDGVWDNEKRINKLISLRSKLKDIHARYQLVSHNEGSKLCSSLHRRISKIIDDYNYVRDVKEEFQEVKRKVFDYRKEAGSIFKGGIDFSSVRDLNRIYSNLKQLSNKRFPGCVPSTWQGDYYSSLEKSMQDIKKKCVKRINYVAKQSSKYRQKIGGSFLSWQTRKFIKVLGKYEDELEAWSKCRVI